MYDKVKNTNKSTKINELRGESHQERLSLLIQKTVEILYENPYLYKNNIQNLYTFYLYIIWILVQVFIQFNAKKAHDNNFVFKQKISISKDFFCQWIEKLNHLPLKRKFKVEKCLKIKSTFLQCLNPIFETTNFLFYPFPVKIKLLASLFSHGLITMYSWSY